jgi:hypothetical protein
LAARSTRLQREGRPVRARLAAEGAGLEDSPVKGMNRLTIEARDNVGHVATKTCEYDVK